MFRRNPSPMQQQPSLESYAVTVENILISIQVDPAQARLSTVEGYGWNFRHGSAIIEIYVSEQDGRGFFQVLAPIMHLPAAGLLPLYRRLLELNLQLTNASIGVLQDVVYIYSERILDGLDAVEATHIMTMIANYADDLDNELVNEFGGRFYGQP